VNPHPYPTLPYTHFHYPPCRRPPLPIQPCWVCLKLSGPPRYQSVRCTTPQPTCVFVSSNKHNLLGSRVVTRDDSLQTNIQRESERGKAASIPQPPLGLVPPSGAQTSRLCQSSPKSFFFHSSLTLFHPSKASSQRIPSRSAASRNFALLDFPIGRLIGSDPSGLTQRLYLLPNYFLSRLPPSPHQTILVLTLLLGFALPGFLSLSPPSPLSSDICATAFLT
jgi:hypothetical protein